MKVPSSERVTELLQAWGRGDLRARDELIPLVYGELRRRAARYLKQERPGHTLRPTALVHEAYLRLLGAQNVAWQNRTHFFSMVAQMMRHILVDHARARGAAKRAGGWRKVSLDEADVLAEERDLDLVAVDEALKRLAAIDPRQSQIVELRFFGGLSVEETAEVAGVSPATVKREWATAKAWLYRRVRDQGSGPEGPAGE